MLPKQVSPLNRSSIRVWQGLLIACAIVAIVMLTLSEAEPSGFRDRVIGIAVVDFVNPAHRNAVYILCIIAGLCAATALFLSIQRRPANTASAAGNERLPYVIAGCAAGNLLAYAVNGEALFLHAAALALLLLALQLLWLWLPHFRQQASTTSSHGFFLSIAFSWQLTTVIFMLANWQIGIPFWLAYAMLSTLALLSCNTWYPRIAGGWGWLQAAAMTWIALSPILFLAAGEISYFTYRNEMPGVAAVWVFVGLSFLSIACAPPLRHRVSNPAYWLGALILMSGVMINEYQGTIHYKWYDLFHFGERVLPLQQWSSYASLPFVDYLPTHGLFDALPHFIYQQLANSSALEALIWGNGYFMGWVMRAFAVLILYHLLSRLLPLKSAFLLIWLLPTHHYLDPYFCLLLLPAIHLLRLPDTPNSMRWWLLQWLLTAALFLWRLDFGAVLIVANLAIAIACSWYSGRLRPLLQCVAWAVVVALLFLGALLLLSDEHSLTDIALQIMAYLASQTLVTSYSHFYHELDTASIMQYLVLPASAVLIAAWSLSRLLQRSTPYTQLGPELLLVFLSAISLMLSLRSLHRHSVMEGSVKTYLFLFIALIFLGRLGREHSQRWGRAIALLCIAFIMATYLFLPAGENTALQAAFHRQPKWEYPIVATGADLPAWQGDSPRLVDQVVRYNGFIHFMQQSLQPEQSFYDFSNAPQLYALADVRLPVYITETLFQSSDTLQHYTRAQLERRRSRQQLPFVVFRQNTPWDALDGVDNALRSYLLAEYIYRHYRPCIRVDQFELWVERGLASAADCQNSLQGIFALSEELQKQLSPLSADYLKQVMDFGAVPYLWARYDRVDEDVSDTLHLKPHRIAPAHWQLALTPGQQACFHSACYLDLTLNSEADNEIVVSFLGRKQFKLRVFKGQYAYRVRLSALWHWYRLDNLKRLKLQGDETFSISKARLVSLDDES